MEDVVKKTESQLNFFFNYLEKNNAVPFGDLLVKELGFIKWLKLFTIQNFVKRHERFIAKIMKYCESKIKMGNDEDYEFAKQNMILFSDTELGGDENINYGILNFFAYKKYAGQYLTNFIYGSDFDNVEEPNDDLRIQNFFVDPITFDSTIKEWKNANPPKEITKLIIDFVPEILNNYVPEYLIISDSECLTINPYDKYYLNFEGTCFGEQKLFLLKTNMRCTRDRYLVSSFWTLTFTAYLDNYFS